MSNTMEITTITENTQPTIYTVIIIFIVFDTLAMILRFISRRISRVRWALADSLIIASWVFTMSFNCLVLGT